MITQTLCGALRRCTHSATNCRISASRANCVPGRADHEEVDAGLVPTEVVVGEEPGVCRAQPLGRTGATGSHQHMHTRGRLLEHLVQEVDADKPRRTQDEDLAVGHRIGVQGGAQGRRQGHVGGIRVPSFGATM